MSTPSASHSLTVRIKYQQRVGNLAALAQAIANAGGSIGSIDIVEAGPKYVIRDYVVDCTDPNHECTIVDVIRALDGIDVVSITDRTFQMHSGGKIEVKSKSPLNARDDLSMAYTPGVARVSTAIAEDPMKAFALTIRHNCVAVVSDGTAVLGLGDVGPFAAMPVMEGKAMLFKEFGGVDAFPICLSTKDPDEIINTVRNIAPTFGGINLEDIAAPKCFEIEDTLRKELDIPVFHDDQHGTAAVVLAALYSALKIVEKDISQIKAVVLGAGAAGVACTKALINAGIDNAIVLDRAGTIYRGRKEGMNPAKEWLAEHTNRDAVKGGIKDALKGADLLLGVSGPGLVAADDLKGMADDAMAFTLSNPTPEIMPEAAAPHVRIIATGRSDYPNQINNVLCFPGLFRGLLDCAAKQVTPDMIIAASKAIADIIKPEELSEDYIIPSVFNKAVAPAVASAVCQLAHDLGLARRLPEDALRPVTW